MQLRKLWITYCNVTYLHYLLCKYTWIFHFLNKINTLTLNAVNAQTVNYVFSKNCCTICYILIISNKWLNGEKILFWSTVLVKLKFLLFHETLYIKSKIRARVCAQNRCSSYLVQEQSLFNIQFKWRVVSNPRYKNLPIGSEFRIKIHMKIQNIFKYQSGKFIHNASNDSILKLGRHEVKPVQNNKKPYICNLTDPKPC